MNKSTFDRSVALVALKRSTRALQARYLALAAFALFAAGAVPTQAREVRDHTKPGDGQSSPDASGVRFRTELEKAIEKASNGKQASVKVDGHEFVIKAIGKSRVGNDTTISGVISHHLSMRKDDQIYYKIRQGGGKTISADMDINRGGFSKLNPIGGWLPTEPVTEWLHPKGGKLLDGSWEGACRYIIASIAARS